MHRQRSGRLAKWQELAREAAREREVKLDLPQSLECHCCRKPKIVF